MLDVKDFALFNKSMLDIGMKQYQYINLLKEFDISTVLDIDDDGFCVIKKGRHTTKIKPGKMYSDETFSHVIKAYKLQNKIKFEEIGGDKSCDYFYNPVVDSSMCSDMGYDCMRYKECQGYFGIVRDNISIFSVLYAFRSGVVSSNDVCGFAILIKHNGVIFYDRIYSYSIQDKIIIEKYCIEKGYKNIYLTNITGLDIDKVSIQLDKWIYDKYPYFDSLYVLNLKTGILSNDDRYSRRNENNVRLRNLNGICSKQNYKDY